MDSNDETRVVPVQVADHPQQERNREIQTLHEGLETCRKLVFEKNKQLQTLEMDLYEMEGQARALANELQKARGEHAREVAALVSQIEFLEHRSQKP